MNNTASSLPLDHVSIALEFINLELCHLAMRLSSANQGTNA
jgi:hypothetical protein